jgi:hypothetical protein
MVDESADEGEPKQGFFSRMKSGLGKTRDRFVEGLGAAILGAKELDDQLLETQVRHHFNDCHADGKSCCDSIVFDSDKAGNHKISRHNQHEKRGVSG